MRLAICVEPKGCVSVAVEVPFSSVQLKATENWVFLTTCNRSPSNCKARHLLNERGTLVVMHAAVSNKSSCLLESRPFQACIISQHLEYFQHLRRVWISRLATYHPRDAKLDICWMNTEPLSSYTLLWPLSLCRGTRDIHYRSGVEIRDEVNTSVRPKIKPCSDLQQTSFTSILLIHWPCFQVLEAIDRF